MSAPIIPPAYKYKIEFDALRSMGFPAREIVSALDSADGDVEIAAAMLLSSTAQTVEEQDVPVPAPSALPSPPSVLQQMFAAQAQTTHRQTHTTATSAATMQNHDYPEETIKNGNKPNDSSDIIALLLDHYPGGIDGSKVKLLFQQKFRRKLSLPEGMALTTWMKSIPGISISSNAIG